MKETFDASALEPEAGVRAIWLLYKRGAWGYLEDFGMVRSEAEPVLRQFEAGNVVAGRLTKAQCRTLAETVPGLVGASVEMRLAYVLKFVDRGMKIDGEYTKILRDEYSGVLKEVNG